MMYKSVIDALLPSFRLVLEDKETHSLPSMQSAIEQALAVFNNHVQFIAPDLQAAIQYALIAWIDDHLKNNAWPFESEWHLHALQRKYYQEHTAGDGFFTKLQQYRLHGQHWSPAILAHCLCLELGFLGRLRLNNKNQASDILQDCYSYLGLTLPKDNASVEKNEIPYTPQLSLYPWAFIALSLFAIGLFFWHQQHLAEANSIFQGIST